MSTPQERNCKGLLQPPPCERQAKTELNFKETELRLGLPGSDSPERKSVAGISLFGKDLKDENGGNNKGFLQTPSVGFVSGGKRCFDDAINGNSKWASLVSDGSEVKTETNEVLFSRARVEVTTKGSLKTVEEEEKKKKNENGSSAPASKAQVVGWPPVRSFRKNALSSNTSKDCNDVASKSSGLYVKVSMEGAPYLRKIDLKTYSTYAELSSALEKMFSCFTIGQCGQGLAGKEKLSESRLMDLLHGSEYVLTYENKDGDWMLVGDVPWEMFADSCKRLRIMKGSEAIGLAPRAMEKSKGKN